jgi:prepilin-type N-terminal cleavage/methylation domain-containing protein
MSWLNKVQSTVYSVQRKQKPETKRFRSIPIRLNSCCGFSLVEVLVAIVIMASGFVLVAQGMGRSQQSLRISENLLTASQIAEERLSEAEIQLREFRKLSSTYRSGEIEFPGNREFTWTQDVSPYGLVKDQTRMWQLNADVEWKEGPLRENKEMLSSLFLSRDKEELK